MQVRKLVEKAGGDIGRIDGLGKAFESHRWQKVGKNDWNNAAPSFRRRVVSGLTAEARKA